MRSVRLFTAFIVLIVFCSCEHVYRLYVVNKASSEKEIVVMLGSYNRKDVESLRFFKAGQWLPAINSKRGVEKRVLQHCSTLYRFNILPGEGTLLKPHSFGTPILGIIDHDTVWFTNSDGHFNSRFKRKGLSDKFIYSITQ